MRHTLFDVNKISNKGILNVEFLNDFFFSFEHNSCQHDSNRKFNEEKNKHLNDERFLLPKKIKILKSINAAQQRWNIQLFFDCKFECFRG